MKRIALALWSAGLAAPAQASAVPGPIVWPVDRDAAPVILLAEAGTGQVLLAQRADLRFVPASMTKVMTAYVALELMAQGRLSPERTVTVRPETWAAWHARGTSMPLRSGESASVSDLLRAITTVSANNASVVLAEGAAGSVDQWSRLMNAEAKALGMADSRFASPNGWPDNGATYVTARDLVKLGRALIDRHPQAYRTYFGQKSMTWNGVTGFNHDPAIGVVQGADGIKTGHTREAGYNFLGSAKRGGRRLMLVVAGARSQDTRALLSRTLLEWGFSNWEHRPLFTAQSLVTTARVQDGDRRTVALVPQRAVAISLYRPAGAPKLGITVHYQGPLRAPLARGQAVARMVIDPHVAGQEAFVVPLVTAQAVGAAGPLDRLWNGLAGLVS